MKFSSILGLLMLVANLGQAVATPYSCAISSGHLVLMNDSAQGIQTSLNWIPLYVEPGARASAVKGCSETLAAYDPSRNSTCNLDSVTRGYIIRYNNKKIAFDGWGFQSSQQGTIEAVAVHSACCHINAYLKNPAAGNMNVDCHSK